MTRLAGSVCHVRRREVEVLGWKMEVLCGAGFWLEGACPRRRTGRGDGRRASGKACLLISTSEFGILRFHG